jgi:polar amino acid transport system permease protein
MMEFTLWDIARNLLLATRWTILLWAVGLVCGGTVGLGLAALRISPRRGLREAARLYIELFQGTPLLMQLFMVFFGLPLLGLDVAPWVAAGLGLTLSASAYLGEIWRGAIEAIPAGQWDAAAALGLRRLARMRRVIGPQALRIAIPPTVGYSVQLVKATALTSIIGFGELLRTANAINNATFAPFTVYGFVALIYFALCFPLTRFARRLERRMAVSR